MLAQVVFMFVCDVHWTDGRSVFETMEPGTVLSRFDYDYEVLKKIIELEKKVDDVGEPKTGCQTTNCPDGWLAYKGSCYLFGPNSVNFQSAKDYCMLHDSRLVWVQTETENIFLKTYMGNNLNVNADFWLGINDGKEEGVWLFTGTEWGVHVFDWGPTEPQDAGSGEDCAAFGHRLTYRWIDVPCTSLRRPLCERR